MSDFNKSSVAKRPTSNYFLSPRSFLVLFEDGGCDFDSPMQQGLSDDGTDRTVVVLGSCHQDLVAELGTEPSLRSTTFQPTLDLSYVVRTTSTLVESTVPLVPTVRIGIADPTGTFPHPQRSAAFHAVLVDGFPVRRRREHGRDR